jgi:hypothetical protein
MGGSLNASVPAAERAWPGGCLCQIVSADLRLASTSPYRSCRY